MTNMSNMDCAAMACLTVDAFSRTDDVVRYRYADATTRSNQEVLLPRMQGSGVGEALYHVYTCYGVILWLTCRDDGAFMLFQKTLLHSSLHHWRNVYEEIPDGTDLDNDCLRQTMQS